MHLWGDSTFLGEVGGPADLGGAQLADAGSVAVAPATGLVYVADSGHNRVLVYGPEGTLQAKWGAGEGNGAAGSAPGAFNHPDAVAVAPSGDVYVADTGNDRVVELSPAGEVIGEWGSRGTADGRFRSPTGIAVDAAGRVYVVDSENNRVQVFEARRARAGEVGAARHRAWRVLAAERGRRRTAAAKCSSPTPTTTASSASTLVCAGSVRLSRARQLAAAAERRAGAAKSACRAPPACSPAAALALQVRCKRGCRILVDGHAVRARRAPRRAPARGRPRAAGGSRRPRAAADRPARRCGGCGASSARAGR